MIHNRGISIVVAVMVMLVTTLASARMKSGRQIGESRMGRVATELQLTPEQERRIDAINASYHDKMMPQRERVKTLRDALNDAIKSDADDRAITAKFDALHVEKKKLDRMRLDRSLEIRSVLTPEQQKKFGTMRGKRLDDIRKRAPKSNIAPGRNLPLPDTDAEID